MAINFEKDRCCGCLACMNICPVGAIEKVKDENGFIYPKVNKEKCIECHLCEKVCDFNSQNRKEKEIKDAYALIHNNNKDIINSTSGGAFTALSDIVLKKNGTVFGTIMDKDFNIYFTEANDIENRNKMRGSKYSQSDPDLIYKKVKESLDSEKEVMFVGTPCQVGALKSFLQKDYGNLLAVEFLCHGVPNNDFLKAHIAYLENKYNKKAINYTFRSKKYTWRAPGIEEITFEGNKTKAGIDIQVYRDYFLKNMSLRESCYNCTYRKYTRVSDITIADFWGFDKIMGEKNFKGASLVLVNSEKGIKVINELDVKEVKLTKVPFEKIKNNISIHSIKSSVDTKEFWQTYKNLGYKGLVNKYSKNNIKEKAKFVVKKEVRKFIGKTLKNK